MSDIANRLRRRADEILAEFCRSGFEADREDVEATAATLRDGAAEIERLSALVYELAGALRAVDDDWLSHRHPLESYPDDDEPPSLIEVSPETVKRVLAALARADAARGEGG